MTQRRKLAGNAWTIRRDGQKQFNPEAFEMLAEELVNGRIPLSRVTLSDEVVPGLRAIIRNTGLISFHVQYKILDKEGRGSRPYLKLGDYPAMQVEEARHLARTVRSLSEANIDVQEGLHGRLMRELKEQGAKWRP